LLCFTTATAAAARAMFLRRRSGIFQAPTRSLQLDFLLTVSAQWLKTRSNYRLSPKVSLVSCSFWYVMPPDTKKLNCL